MDCGRCQDLLSEWILGPKDAVSDAERAEAEAHVGQCADCQKERKAYTIMRTCLPTTQHIV